MWKHTAEKGNVCCVTAAVRGVMLTPAAVGCCTKAMLATGCAANDDDVDTARDGADAADEDSTGDRTDMGSGGRTPSMCILFMLNECRNNGKLFYSNKHYNQSQN